VKTPLTGQEHKILAAEQWEVLKSIHSIHSTSRTCITISITVPQKVMFSVYNFWR